MTANASVLQRVLAVWDGSVDHLSRVEAALARRGKEDPLADLRDFAAAAHEDLAGLLKAQAEPRAVPPAELRRLSRLLGWLIESLRTWAPAEDPGGRRLEAALTTASLWDRGGDLWASLAPLLPDRDPLSPGLQVVLSCRAAEPRIPPDTPLWEREHLDSLRRAERACAWDQLSDAARAFTLPEPDSVATQAGAALSELDPVGLVAMADRADEWLKAHLIVASVPLGSGLRLAARSTSGHVGFAALERATRHSRPFSADEEQALEDLFTALAEDEARWPGWMAAYNRHPVRRPSFQPALGRALARSSGAAARAYVDSIELTTPGAEGGLPASACLGAFRRGAQPELRRTLWSRAYERWDAWDFGAAEDQGLNQPGRSELDYAVIGWLLEGVDPSVVELEVQAFQSKLRALEAAWHASGPASSTAFNRLLSRHQLFAHALQCSPETSDWMPDRHAYFPPAVQGEYAQARRPLSPPAERGKPSAV